VRRHPLALAAVSEGYPWGFLVLIYTTEPLRDQRLGHGPVVSVTVASALYVVAYARAGTVKVTASALNA